MNDKPIFISKSQRVQLKNAFLIIEKIKKEISVEHEEYSAINTTLYYLRSAINNEEKYY